MMIDPKARFPSGPQVLASVIANNTALYGADIAALPGSLTLLSNAVVEGFVVRTAADGGTLPVRLRLSGIFGLPSEGHDVYAEMKDPDALHVPGFLGTNRSDANGIVNMHLRIRKPPGRYSVLLRQASFQTSGDGNLYASIAVHVRGCVAGEVAPIPNTCEPCVPGGYSLDPTRHACEPCPEGAICPGGAVIVPLPGWWHSTADSAQINRCVSLVIGSLPTL
jgi:hypothetical protein